MPNANKKDAVKTAHWRSLNSTLLVCYLIIKIALDRNPNFQDSR